MEWCSQARSTDSDCWYNLGMTLKNDEASTENAIDDFSHAFSAALIPWGIQQQGKPTEESERYEEALTDYNKTLAMKPDYAEAYFNRGQLMMDLKKDEEAKKDFSRAIGLNHKNSDAHNNLGIILANENNSMKPLATIIRPSRWIRIIHRRITTAAICSKKKTSSTKRLATIIRPLSCSPIYRKGNNNRGLLFMKQKNTRTRIMISTRRLRCNLLLPKYISTGALRLQTNVNWARRLMTSTAQLLTGPAGQMRISTGLSLNIIPGKKWRAAKTCNRRLHSVFSRLRLRTRNLRKLKANLNS